MKRILIFSLAYYPDMVSGAEVAVREITDRIDDIEFHLVTLRFHKDRPEREKIGNVVVHRVGWGGAYLSKMLFVPLAAFEGARLNRTLRFDAVWALMTYMLMPVVLAKVLGVSAPHILTLQDGDPYERVFERWFVRPFMPILDYGFRTAAKIQAISAYLAEWPARRGYKGDVEIVYNGANALDFGDIPYPTDLAEKLAKREGEVLLVTTSRLVHKNGLDTVIEALPLLPEHVRFIVVGSGEDEEKLKELAANRGVSHRVTFVGNVDRTETPRYRKVSDIFVRPSRSEGMGNSFVSAFAARRPVIATKEGGIAEFLFDERVDTDRPGTGWAVRKESPEDIRDAVLDILANPERVMRVTQNAYKLAYNAYNWDGIARSMRERVFAPVLDK